MTNERQARMLGPWMTLALVISGVVGVGIFYLPIALAPLGGSVPIGWLISGIGVMSMAYCASRIVSPDGGGLQAYVENELGTGAGFLVTWMTWCSTCVGNPAVALAAAAGLATIVPGLAGHLVLVASAFFVVLTLVNLRGIKAVGELAIVTVLIKVLPLIAVVVIAAMLGGGGAPLEPIDVPPPSLGNIATASALCLFALTGFEFSLSPVGKIRNPERNLARALVIGLAGIAVSYLLVTLSLSLIMPNSVIAKSIAPFPEAIGNYWGAVAGVLAAAAMVVSAFGTLNASILACGEMLYSMSLRNDMPRYFSRTNRFNAPYAAQIASVTLGFILLGLNEAKGTTQLFTFITLLATDAVLYLYSAAAVAAAIKDRKPTTTIACVIGLAFVLFAFYGSGLEAFLLSLGLFAAGGVLYFIRKPWTNPAPEVAPAAPRE
ncbi:MAG TPA: APC family permease [Sphingomicrobium sp.]|nr:APC family permease [Sphingomicrobium sp.]